MAAEKLEIVLSRCPLVAQIFVYGDSMQAYLVAVVVPEAEEVTAWAKAAGVSGGSLKAICANAGEKKKLDAALMQQLTAAGKAAKFAGFEMVKKLHLDPEPWTVENGMLTPTFKMKRADLKKKYQAALDGLYGVAPTASKL